MLQQKDLIINAQCNNLFYFMYTFNDCILLKSVDQAIKLLGNFKKLKSCLV